jgi:hypothetical protein
MKKIIAAAFAVTLALAAFAPHAVAADGKQGANAVLVPASDVKRKDLPGFKGADGGPRGESRQGAASFHAQVRGRVHGTFAPSFVRPLRDGRCGYAGAYGRW